MFIQKIAARNELVLSLYSPAGNKPSTFVRARQEMLSAWMDLVRCGIDRDDAEDEIQATASAMHQLMALGAPNAS